MPLGTFVQVCTHLNVGINFSLHTVQLPYTVSEVVHVSLLISTHQNNIKNLQHQRQIQQVLLISPTPEKINKKQCLYKVQRACPNLTSDVQSTWTQEDIILNSRKKRLSFTLQFGLCMFCFPAPLSHLIHFCNQQTMCSIIFLCVFIVPGFLCSFVSFLFYRGFFIERGSVFLSRVHFTNKKILNHAFGS